VGWADTLYRQNGTGWEVYGSDVTVAGGSFNFSGLIPGTYYVAETQQTGWIQTDGPRLPGDDVFIVTEISADPVTRLWGPVYFGNRSVFTKTFELTFEGDGPDSSIAFFARFWVDGETDPRPDLTLAYDSASGTSSNSVPMEYMDEITRVEWYATWNGHDVLLGETAGETIDKDITNYFKYNGGMGGYIESGLAGWIITLYRQDGTDWEVYDITQTVSGGSFNFSGLIPGTYYVAETQQTGWIQTDGPRAAGDDFFVVTEISADPVTRLLGPVLFGNRSIFTKTFELTFEGDVPSNTGFLARYWLLDETDPEADLQLLDLDSDEVFSNSVAVEYGTTIAKVEWWAVWNGYPALLGTDLFPNGETITESMTNSFTYGASIHCGKFEDVDSSAVWESDEDGIADWEITLYYMTPDGWKVYATATTGADGLYEFTGLLPGDYYAEEESRDGWTQTVGPAAEGEGLVTVENGDSSSKILFGNQRDGFTKTFELTGVAPVADAWVTYWIDGDQYTLALSHVGGIFTGKVVVPADTVIEMVEWWTSWNGEDVKLGDGAVEETIDSDLLNTFAYDSSVHGHKFMDFDEDGVWDTGGDFPDIPLSGWTIELYRMDSGGDWVKYAEAITDAEGYYEFNGVLPGTYYLSEVLQTGWMQTAGPMVIGAGSFDVEDGTDHGPIDFGNTIFAPFTDIEIDKIADKVVADPGDIITYTIRYRAFGDPATDIVIIDDFDERYVTVVSGQGLDVDAVAGTITWIDPDPLSEADGWRTLTYKVQVHEEMPEGTTNIDNIVVMTSSSGGGSDDWRVTVTKGIPYLPFTGGQFGLIVLAALMAAGMGLALKRRAVYVDGS